MSLIDANRDGIAIDGFDAVSYFKGEPLRGTADFTFELDGTTYMFNNAENLEEFQENPAKYIPAYGGYCLRGMSEGQRRRGNPENYAMNGGRLYFYYRGDLEDARISPDNDMPAYIKQADNHWLRENGEHSSLEMQNLHDSQN